MRIILVATFFLLFTFGAQNTSYASITSLLPLPEPLARSWEQLDAQHRFIAVSTSCLTSVLGFILGWALFPLTIAPLAYLTQSELAIWGGRLSMAIIGALSGYIFPLMLIVKLFSS